MLFRSGELLSERAPVAVVERILSAASSALAPERACLLALGADGRLLRSERTVVYKASGPGFSHRKIDRIPRRG